jgi:CBS-domain-containing membrane protein
MTLPEPKPSLPQPGSRELEVVRGLIERMRMTCLLERFPQRLVWAVFMFVNGFLTIAILAGVAMLTNTPTLFPSLGPTAFLFFFTPTAPTASPRNTLCGHALGILCGYGSLVLFGLQDSLPVNMVGVDIARVLCAGLSLGATGALMILFNVAHPPAGATTLIVSLGIIRNPLALLVVEVAVVLLTVQAVIINRLAGIDYPLWAKPSPPAK